MPCENRHLNVAHSERPIPEIVLVATFGDRTTGGGLFAFRGAGVERIDDVSSMGLACDGPRLARVLRTVPEQSSVTEIVTYDRSGITRYLRIDDTPGAHDVAWDGDELVVVSTWDNAVRWYGLDGVVRRDVRFPGPPDSWHVNCVVRADGRWYATIFGDFGAFRGWAPPASLHRGRIVALDTQETIVDGLSSPHNPRLLDDQWWLCDSARDELAIFDAWSGREVKRIACGGWTRGLAIDASFAYVGVSKNRTASGTRRAEIVVVDRETKRIVERTDLPVQEVYDLAIVPAAIVEGARCGFGVNPTRIAESRQWELLRALTTQDDARTLWPTGDPLPANGFACRIEADIPDTVRSGELMEIAVTVRNTGPMFFAGAPPCPVSVSYRWSDRAGEPLTNDRALRSPLPRTVWPGETVVAPCRIPDRKSVV